MAHLTGKDIHRRLGGKIDRLGLRAPWNATFHSILRELYSTEEADLVLGMPNGLSTLEEIRRVTAVPEPRLKRLLEGLCTKGLVMDLWVGGTYHYLPSPLMIGIFELTMMRGGQGRETVQLARLFHDYLHDGEFFAANFGKGEQVSILRALPHEGTVRDEPHVEVLDYEKARSVVIEAEVFAVGICSCRHEKHHAGEKKCSVPLESCTSFGFAAQYLIRRGLARKIDRAEMFDLLDRSRELGLVLNADNVRRNVTYLCHCCPCCCTALLGISRFGYPNSVVTSSFLASVDENSCIFCRRCEGSCPIGALVFPPEGKKAPLVDRSLCLGCGVCALHCPTGALGLEKREQQVLHPETIFHKVVLQNLERGTLQHQIFSNPKSLSDRALGAILGAFLRLPPVKRALMSDQLRSRFLAVMSRGVGLQGRDWLTRL